MRFVFYIVLILIGVVLANKIRGVAPFIPSL
jgi:hypothetical protein